MTLLHTLIAIPLVAAALTIACTSRRLRAVEMIGVAGSVLAFLFAGYGFLHGVHTWEHAGLLSPDAFGMLLTLCITFVGSAAAIYSVGYLRVEREKGIVSARRTVQFWALFHLFIFAMLLSVMTRYPIIAWVAIEATTLATVFLVSFYKKSSSLEAGWKYLVVNSVGLLIGFFGTLTMLSAAGSSTGFLSWNDLAAAASTMDPLALKVAFICILVGYGTKAGLVPMHTWLPDAHGKAPAPISALLSGVLLNAAIFAIVRYKVAVDAAIGPWWTGALLLVFGVLSIVVMGFMLLVQSRYKRMLAYSSIENMGLCAIGFGLGGIAVWYTVLHMLYHALVKSALFLASGNLFLSYGSGKIENIRGMLRTLPWTAPLFFLGVVAVVGMPPFGTFMTKLGILSSATEHPGVVGALLLAVTLVFAGYLIHTSAMLFGTPPAHAPEGGAIVRGERGWRTVFPILLLLTTALYLGVHLPAPLAELVADAASTYTPER